MLARETMMVISRSNLSFYDRPASNTKLVHLIISETFIYERKQLTDSFFEEKTKNINGLIKYWTATLNGSAINKCN